MNLTVKTICRLSMLMLSLASCDDRTPFERGGLLEGAPNFRDLGAYSSADGRRTVPRKVFRSQTLAGLSDRDVETLKTLNIKTVIDFRSDEEVLAGPSRLPEDVRVVRLPVAVGNTGAADIMRQIVSGETDSLQAIAFMETINRRFVTDFTQPYRDFFDILLRPESYPVVFHCTAGKDRTGFAAALLLSALDIDWETVMDDYLLTNQYLKPQQLMPQVPEQAAAAIRQLWGVRSSYLNAARREIVQRTGGIDHYLSRELNVGEAEKTALKRLLLE